MRLFKDICKDVQKGVDTIQKIEEVPEEEVLKQFQAIPEYNTIGRYPEASLLISDCLKSLGSKHQRAISQFHCSDPGSLLRYILVFSKWPEFELLVQSCIKGKVSLNHLPKANDKRWGDVHGLSRDKLIGAVICGIIIAVLGVLLIVVGIAGLPAGAGVIGFIAIILGIVAVVAGILIAVGGLIFLNTIEKATIKGKAKKNMKNFRKNPFKTKYILRELKIV